MARRKFAISSQVSPMPARPRLKALIPGMRLPTAVLTNCKTIRRSQFPSSLFLAPRVRVQLRESVSPIHHAARRDRAADGGDLTRRYRCLYPITGLGTSRGRLSHHPGSYLLLRRQPDRDGDDGYGTARAPVWPASGTQP